ncbi:hypothetical protein BHE74_00053099 [Ensete ventricosum]|nr:hypothetical protein BHE74_00053099 [Ensete ventricosum]
MKAVGIDKSGRRMPGGLYSEGSKRCQRVAEVIPRVQLRNNNLPLSAFVKESMVARNKAASGSRWMGLWAAQESRLALRKRERGCEQWVMMMRGVVVAVVAIDESKLAFMGCMRRARVCQFARSLLNTKQELARMSGDSELGLGGRLLEWWSPGREGVLQFRSIADSCKKVGSGRFPT